MSDVNAFVDTVGKDLTTVAVPRIEALAAGVSAKVVADYVPRVSAFANQLVKEVIDEQSAHVRDFVTALIQELCQRYRPELVGELHTRFVQNAVQVTGHGIRLDLKRQDTGALVSSLDIPVSLNIKVDDLVLNLQDTSIKLDLVK
jgi:hypothetical protein